VGDGVKKRRIEVRCEECICFDILSKLLIGRRLDDEERKIFNTLCRAGKVIKRKALRKLLPLILGTALFVNLHGVFHRLNIDHSHRGFSNKIHHRRACL
jgi:hypothetical protein